MSIVKWGILSTARHAANMVIPAIHASANGQATAVASRDGARARQYADDNHIAHSYDSYEALLADPDIDAVYIPLPNHLHKEWAIRAAQAGKHVLCEKPLALNAADAAEMVRVFREAGLRLAETFQWRHHPQGTRVRQMVREGQIGDVCVIHAAFSFMLDRPGDIRWQPDMGGGALYDVGCYPIALMRYMTGAEPLTATAQAHWGQTGVDDSMVVTLAFPDNVLGHFDCAFILPLRRYFEVVGTTGSLMVNRAYNPIGDRADEVWHYGSDRALIDTIDLGVSNSYELMAQDFNLAVLEDRDPLFPGEDAIHNMRVIDAVYRATREGGTVEVS